ncbi:uncharacterized protein LOC134270323 [Saccostrea cucullata]|uniref:uncharacterized protein LOC134270323 n=1 Tax=Saccostrea cuccullata TaxID=36930 RepID=UPI002ED3CDFD
MREGKTLTTETLIFLFGTSFITTFLLIVCVCFRRKSKRADRGSKVLSIEDNTVWRSAGFDRRWPDSSFGRAPDRSFRGPGFESRSGPLHFLLSRYMWCRDQDLELTGERPARDEPGLGSLEGQRPLRREECGGQPGSIAGGQIAHSVEHLTGVSGGPGSNPGLVRCIFSSPVTTAIPNPETFNQNTLIGGNISRRSPQLPQNLPDVAPYQVLLDEGRQQNGNVKVPRRILLCLESIKGELNPSS